MSEPTVPRSAFHVPRSIVDSHVHFWDPAELRYPWLDELPSLARAFLPSDYTEAIGDGSITQVLFVEANCRPEEAGREVQLVLRLAQRDPRIAGLVAFANLVDAPEGGLEQTLDALSCSPLVKGIRHNIQGHAAGFALQRTFVAGVREVGRRDWTFDLCVTHDQLSDVTELAGLCPDTQLVLDHCGKPSIRSDGLAPWRRDIGRLAERGNVCCKLSGLLTEAAPAQRRDEDLAPYASAVVESFGTERVMYGSDWPVCTLAGTYRDWYGFTQRFTAGWPSAERRRFYAENATRVYRL